MTNSLLRLLDRSLFEEFSKKILNGELEEFDLAEQIFLMALYLIRTENSECQSYIPENFSKLEKTQQPQVLTEFADYLSRHVSRVAAEPIFDQLLSVMPQHHTILETYLRHLIRHEAYTQAASILYDYRRFLNPVRRVELEISVLDGLGRLQEAIALAKINRQNDKELLAILTSHTGDYESSIRLFESVGNSISTRGAYEFSLNLLKMGDYRRGWVYYESRPKNGPHAGLITRIDRGPHQTTIADRGSPPVFVCEQGIGDQLIFLRFASQFRETVGERMKVLLDYGLKRVLDSPGFSGLTHLELISKDDFDSLLISGCRVLGLASLPRYLQTLAPSNSEETFDCPPPEYKDSLAQRRWRENGQNSNIIGVAWKSGAPRGAQLKSIPMDFILELASSGFKLVNLNFDVGTEIEITERGWDKYFAAPMPPNWKDLPAVYSALQSCRALIGLSNTYCHLGQLFDLPTDVRIPNSRGALWYWHNIGKLSQTTPWYRGVNLVCL